jgi:hypothetical protein
MFPRGGYGGSRSVPQDRGNLGEDGHARAAFRRATARGKLVGAEIEAREVGRLDLSEALELTALMAPRDRERLNTPLNRVLTA